MTDIQGVTPSEFSNQVAKLVEAIIEERVASVKLLWLAEMKEQKTRADD